MGALSAHIQPINSPIKSFKEPLNSIQLITNISSANTFIYTHQAHQHNDDSQLEVLHTHSPCQITACGPKCD